LDETEQPKQALKFTRRQVRSIRDRYKEDDDEE
jgi:hypothetical protein